MKTQTDRNDAATVTLISDDALKFVSGGGSRSRPSDGAPTVSEIVVTKRMDVASSSLL